MHLFIPNATLTTSEREIARTHDPMDFSLGNTDGLLFDEDRALAYLLVIDAVEIERNDTDYDGVQKLAIRFPRQPDRAPKEVRCGHWCIDLPFQRFASMVENIFQPAAGMDVWVDLKHGRQAGPFDDNFFHILVYSSQENEPRVRVPQELWGLGRTTDDPAYPATGRGDSITAPDAPDYVVAEIVGDALYVHHNALRSGTERELAIFRHILEEAAILLGATEEEREARREARRKAERERARVTYIEACRGRLHKQVEAAKRALEESPDRINEARKELTAAIRAEALARMEVERLRGKTEDMDTAYAAEFDKLTEHPKVVDVRMANGKLMVYTDTLFCTDERTGKLHEIGSFRIELNVSDRDVSDGAVRWFNLDRQVDGCDGRMQAPHVWHQGHACLGNAHEAFAELFASYEFALAIDYAIQFVESANTDDAAGKHVDKWPLAKEQPRQAQVAAA